MDFATKRAEAEERLGTLRRERGAAYLETGKTPATLLNSIAAAEAEMQTLDEAEGEQARRSREAAEAEARATRAAWAARVWSLEDHRLEQMERAERAALEFAEAAGNVISITAEQRQALTTMTGRPPLAFEALEAQKRLSGRLSIVLAGASGRPDYFGDIALHSLPYADVTKTWRELEGVAGRAAIIELIGEPQE